MDPDQPAHPHSLIRIQMLFAISFLTCYRICKRTAWILIRLRGCAGWSGSMLVANTLCCFCHDAAQIYIFTPFLPLNLYTWLVWHCIWSCFTINISDFNIRILLNVGLSLYWRHRPVIITASTQI
jgi:hypothetical protein